MRRPCSASKALDNMADDYLYPGSLFKYREEFITLKGRLSHMNRSVPTLYRQYTEICESGGAQFAGFNMEPEFKNAIDGPIVVDLARLKPSRRGRYPGY